MNALIIKAIDLVVSREGSHTVLVTELSDIEAWLSGNGAPRSRLLAPPQALTIVGHRGDVDFIFGLPDLTPDGEIAGWRYFPSGSDQAPIC